MLKTKKKTVYKAVNTISNINIKDWNAIKTPNLFLDLAYLKTIEETVSDVQKFIYVIYYKNELPIGKSIFQLLQYDASTFNFDSIPCHFTNKIFRVFLNKKLQVLIVGNIFATGENAFSFIEGTSSKQIFKTINKVVSTIIKKDKTINYALFKEFYPTSVESNILSKNYHFLKFNIDVNMVLSIKENWSSFDDLLIDFKTKYRSRFKNIIEKSKTLIVQEFSLTDTKKYAEKLNDLYQQVIQNSNFNIGTFNTKTFVQLKEQVDSYHIFGYFINDELIGFRSSFLNDNNLETSFIGIDYSKNLKYDLYQRMLVDYITFGLQHNVKTVSFGRTAETIKSCVGAEPITMNLFIKARKKTGQFLMRLIVKNINPTAFSLRQPFKKQFYI